MVQSRKGTVTSNPEVQTKYLNDEVGDSLKKTNEIFMKTSEPIVISGGASEILTVEALTLGAAIGSGSPKWDGFFIR